MPDVSLGTADRLQRPMTCRSASAQPGENLCHVPHQIVAGLAGATTARWPPCAANAVPGQFGVHPALPVLVLHDHHCDIRVRR